MDATLAAELSDESAGPANENSGANTENRVFPRLDGEVGPLVAAHADVIAPCRWMGGAEVTLSTAICNYYMIMTEENADQVLADIYEFIANEISGKEELDEQNEEKPESEEPEDDNEKTDAKPEPQKEPAKPEQKPESKPKEPAPPEKTVSKVVEAQPLPQPRLAGKESPKKVASSHQKTAPTQTVSRVTTNTVTKPAGHAAQPRPAVSVKASPETTNHAPSTAEARGGEHKVEYVAEPHTIPAGVESSARQAPAIEPESPAVVEAGAQAEIMPRVEPGEPIPILEENQTVRESETEEISSELLEETSVPVQPALITSELLTDLPPVAAPSLELIGVPGPTLIAADELLEFPPVEPEPILEAEKIIYEFAEEAKGAGPRIAAEIEVTPEEIMEAAAKPEIPIEDINNMEQVPPDDLEEAIIELLEVLDINCPPEAIESLVYLVSRWGRAAHLEKPDGQKDTRQLLEGVGTHEIIKKLLIGLNTAHKTRVPAEALGKSALLLCAA